MTFGEVKALVLKLINQYSIAGVDVAESYNNQKDYLRRVTALVNDAVTEIATTARKIPALLELTPEAAEDLGKAYRFRLPDDFYQFKSGDTVLTTEDGRVLHTNRYAIQGSRYVIIPKKELEDAACTLTYYRYPRLLDGENPDEAAELDNEPETHYAAAYYAASFLVAQDDAFLCSLLYNKYEDKLGKMGPGVSAEAHATQDLYAANYGDGYF